MDNTAINKIKEGESNSCLAVESTPDTSQIYHYSEMLFDCHSILQSR